ncbi:WD domain-containing protein [Massariosphaeria phaeospora]|uniref:WD domain-containing protein n=1 Tax=Massariosphaeria phaeospora TaxID=100035 RepID=A0A7C8I154_9PLEO|nr:WD domain-containing protein [Massariosphaeria phaeospora]
MSPGLRHDYTRVPITALASAGPFLFAAEGPFLRIYHSQGVELLTSRRIFRAQAVHGIAVHSDSRDHLVLVVWGGLLIRALDVYPSSLQHDSHQPRIGQIQTSPTVRAPDWILDLSFSPVIDHGASNYRCAAVTAHNALLELELKREDRVGVSKSPSHTISLTELTSSSRSILYSAHLYWDSLDNILVAAGTAFGEIIFWSWTRNPSNGPNACIHRVFLGHEGSIFGVQLSKEFEFGPGLGRRRLLASCSDDRTIRIWDISGIATIPDATDPADGDTQSQRTRHTGFSNASYEMDASNSVCAAIGWAHTSRVWTVRFLEPQSERLGVYLLSTGEDATTRIWNLTPKAGDIDSVPYSAMFDLKVVSTAAYHAGKNIWSSVIWGTRPNPCQVVSAAADGKLIAYPLLNGVGFTTTEYTVQDITSAVQAGTDINTGSDSIQGHRSSKVAEFFRSYAFIDDSTFVLTMNSGRVYHGSMHSESDQIQLLDSKLIGYSEYLLGYSICTGDILFGVAFIAGLRGTIYIYRKSEDGLQKLCELGGKVGSMFVRRWNRSPDSKVLVLLVTLVGQPMAQLLYIHFPETGIPTITGKVSVATSEPSTGLIISSMVYISAREGTDYLLLGFRRGSIAAYIIPTVEEASSGTTEPRASLVHIIDKVHGKETVTSMSWLPSSSATPSGHLVSVGRDGRIAVHSIDFARNHATLVHNLTLPIGPNIEAVYFHHDRLLVHGFSSKKFVQHDTLADEEIMSVDTGGAHRSWAFQPHAAEEGGGTLVWTRASSMHVCTQAGSNHHVIRPGGHGREIKAVAVSHAMEGSTPRQLVATGAEDTDIRIFEAVGGALVCRRTLRKHVTGIQHLQWSDDGQYLFSSGGYEEFFVWRVRALPSSLGGIGVVCESVCVPESEHSDLRIMAFDVRTLEEGFAVAMVFSDSNVRVYAYTPTAPAKWHTLAAGTYSTSCLTQCIFLSTTTILTTGTDGHLVLWPLSSPLNHPQTPPTSPLTWHHPIRIHQNTSKTLASHALSPTTTLLVSGGDDGALAFLLLSTSTSSTPTTPTSPPAHYPTHPPLLVPRAHASAITACAIVSHRATLYVVTAGNDQWVRLWELTPQTGTGTVAGSSISAGAEVDAAGGDALQIRRLGRIKTSVADVSSMAVLGSGESGSDGEGDDGKRGVRILLCGVGMEVICVS